jgi:hypothetical protein
MKIGALIHGNLMVRCPFCGDSQHSQTKAHLSISVQSGVYHCFRCKVSGKLTAQQSLQLFSNDWPAVEAIEPSNPENITEFISSLQAGPGTTRASLLNRHHTIYHGETRDVFLMLDPYDCHPTGVHLRSPEFSKNFGDVGVAWPGDHNWILISSESQPLRLVEGPYDVVEVRDVCVFGTISQSVLKLLSGHHVILCPDGDIWQDPGLNAAFMRTVNKILGVSTINLVGIEVLPDGKDPDQVSPADRPRMARGDVIHYLAMKSKRITLFT